MVEIYKMPYGIRFHRKQKCYSVYNKNTKRVFSKCTSKKKAIKQSRLLRAIMYNKDFRPIATIKNRTRKQNKTRKIK